MQPGLTSRISFGVFEVDLAARELRKGGVRVKLQQQPFRVLQMLLERPREVITREELQEKLWSDDTFVEFDKNLNTAVQKIRQALGDSSTAPRYVETVPRVGYRFIAPVNAGDASAPREPPKNTRPTLAWALASLSTLLLVGAAFMWQRQPAPLPRVPFEGTPLTAYPGREIDPEFSPDGNQVAFAWDGGDGGNFDIYLKTIGPGDPVPLTEDPNDDIHPAWSPDGRFIAFTRSSAYGYLDDVIVIPALGGRERPITQVGSRGTYTWTDGRSIAWTADSRWLIVTEPTLVTGQSARLFLVSVTTGKQRRLTSPPRDASAPTGDIHPAVSPDGRWVAFERRASTTSKIFKIPLSEDPGPAGAAEQVTPDPAASQRRPVWSAESDSIIYSEGENESLDRLWLVAAAGDRAPEPLHITGFDPAVSPDARRMVYQRVQRVNDIWELELAAAGLARGEPREVIASTNLDHHPEYSPDGTSIVFTSYRSGSGEIWVADRDGSHPLPLTDFGGPRTGTPRWSPDGRFILFNSTVAGNKEVFLIPANGGEPQPMTNHPADDAMPAWASDSKSFYVRSNRSGRDEIWRIPVEGGEAVQITRGGARVGYESADGKWLYYVKANQLWRAPAEGGEGALIAQDIHSHKWRLTKDGVYYTPAAVLPDEGANQIWYLDFAKGTSRLVIELDAAVAVASIAPDGRSLLFMKMERVESDLMLIEDFE